MPLSQNDQDVCVMYSRGLNAPEMCAYKYCYNRGIGKKLTIIPKNFRAWMSKNSHDGSCVSERHGWRVFKNLGDRGFGEIIRSGFGRIELVLYSLDFVCERKSQAETETPKPDPEKTDDSSAAKKSAVKQQQLILTKQVCKSFGVNYRLEKDWWEIASHGLEKVKATLNRMMIQIASSRTTIHNPCGWLRIALRDNYYLDTPDPVNTIARIEQTFFWAKEELLNLTGSIPKKNTSQEGHD